MKFAWCAAIGIALGCLILPAVSHATTADGLSAALTAVPYKIVYETWQDDNWELFVVDADGSDPTNLTNTPDAHELYPHASPDGGMVCFVCDEGVERRKSVTSTS